MAQPLSLVTVPTPSLRIPSVAMKPQHIGTPECQAFLDALVETMRMEKGVGIAAPQVGRNERIFIVDSTNGAQAYINPTVEIIGELTEESEEGCLSVPGIYGIVKRAKKIRVTAFDRHARRISHTTKGFPAIIFQHEMDHLNGVLFIDKVERYTQGGKTVRV